MDLKHKHHAIIWVAGLSVVFIGACVWYALRPTVSGVDSGSPTPQVASPAPVHSPVTLYESGRFFEATGQYPSVVPLPGETGATAAATLQTFVTDQIEQFITAGDFDALTPEDIAIVFPDDRKYTLDVTYAVFSGPRTLSYVFDVYTDTLGAHPNVRYATFTFDSVTGDPLELADLFIAGSEPLSILSERTRLELPALIAQRGGGDSGVDWMLLDGTRPTVENFSAWRIEDTSLVLMFQSYQVGPYVLGPIELPIPLASLGTDLRPEYLP